MKWAREEVEWHSGFFTVYSQSGRLDGRTQKPRIEVADPGPWVLLTVFGNMAPAQAAKFAEAVKDREEPGGEPPASATELAYALDDVVRLMTADGEPPRLIARFDDKQVEKEDRTTAEA